MFDASSPSERSPTFESKALALLAALIAYGSNFWPEPLVLRAGTQIFHLTSYEGWGIFLPHLLLYTTVMAAVSALLWWVLVRTHLLEPPNFGNLRYSTVIGIIGGIAALLLTLAVCWFAFPSGVIHWIPPNPWKIAGNLFSNFYEEFVYRGFLLVALKRVIGFWPAALLSSATWAFLHTQYPLVGQLTILAVGVGFCWLAQHARSLWAPYIAHEVLDLVGDSLIG